jgi:beta-galactosidase beta subunit
MKIRIIKKKQLKEMATVGSGTVQGALKKEIKEVSSEEERKFMCAMANKPADERPEGLSEKEAEEMCKDTEHSKKIDEMFSTAGAMMGSGSGEIPKERNPEAHKRYVRIRYTRQGLQNFKPNRYFAENNK